MTSITDKKFNFIDVLVLTIYLSIGTGIYVLIANNIFSAQACKKIVSWSGFWGDVILLGFYFRRWRVLSVWLTWMGIALIQLYLVYALRKNPIYEEVNGFDSDMLCALFITLITFRLFNFLYKKMYKNDFIFLADRFGGAKFRDTYDLRFPRFADILFSMLIFLITILGMAFIPDLVFK